MSFNKPKKEMLNFSSQFGGVDESFEMRLFGRFSLYRIAYQFIDDMLKNEFEGNINKVGQTLSFDLQILANTSPNAIAGLYENIFCIGVFKGLEYKIMEIAHVVLRFTYLNNELEKFPVVGAGFKYQDFIKSTDDINNFLFDMDTGYLKPIMSAGYLDKFKFVTHSVLWFVLLHEMFHIVKGHLGYMTKDSKEFYLSESEGVTFPKNLKFQYYCELEADAEAFNTVLFHILDNDVDFGLENVGNTDEKLLLFFLGCLLLSNTWAISSIKKNQNSQSHPNPILRMLNIYHRPAMLSGIWPHHTSKLQNLFNDSLMIGDKMAQFDNSYQNLVLPVIEGYKLNNLYEAMKFFSEDMELLNEVNLLSNYMFSSRFGHVG